MFLAYLCSVAKTLEYKGGQMIAALKNHTKQTGKKVRGINFDNVNVDDDCITAHNFIPPQPTGPRRLLVERATAGEGRVQLSKSSLRLKTGKTKHQEKTVPHLPPTHVNTRWHKQRNGQHFVLNFVLLFTLRCSPFPSWRNSSKQLTTNAHEYDCV